MCCTNTLRISSSLHKAALAVSKITERNSRIQQCQLDQALDIRQVADSFDQTVDEFEVLTMHLGCATATESYFYQAQQHVHSVRLMQNDLRNTLASITDADIKFGQEMRSSYAQFLSHISCYAGDDTQALASLSTITGNFDEFNLQQHQRLATMHDQLDSYILVLSKIAALKHGLEEQGLI
ncbi:hypothetical protein FOC4_g10012291 [Fusarium odoratissimum]|uniref:Uncharacterized protein n=3 Tax=Fusarium oxysporum species complex TaxID=171631 RepID=N1RFS2_FUSC4|nr:uncharacterized protein FOIG_12466 [Fusarium odoratissimum NRRL 54006]EMT61000.1 hypothetical protein FOC4_g10012291 [Fusarium odoratissimum]EXL95031.1 hypothetical protein FOIG_12466 [Fusarium odoratissimum NRRL 54006]TXC11809.1 hypothetical protein FocTR4_00006136 [Fusarium oxysporum f. sp. cubense]